MNQPTAPAVQFVTKARQVNEPQTYQLYCQVCHKFTSHLILPDQGNCERYQCPCCGLIREVAVR